jgi:hypothetical protein
MSSSQRLLTSIALFIGAWLCLFYAALQLPTNQKNLSDTEGLNIVVMLAVALQAINIAAIAFASAGIVLPKIIKPKSLTSSLIIFFISNSPLIFASLLGILVLGLYQLDTLSCIAGISLYVGTISLIMSATPRRGADKKQ